MAFGCMNLFLPPVFITVLSIIFSSRPPLFPQVPLRHIWTPPVLQAETSTDEERVCGHISGFLVEPHLFRALMVVARQLLSIPTA